MGVLNAIVIEIIIIHVMIQEKAWMFQSLVDTLKLRCSYEQKNTLADGF